MNPYFYLGVKEGRIREVEAFLRRKFDRLIEDIIPQEKIDLDMARSKRNKKKKRVTTQLSLFLTVLTFVSNSEKPFVWP